MRSTGPKAAVYQIPWDTLKKPFDLPQTDEREGEWKECLEKVSPPLMPDAQSSQTMRASDRSRPPFGDR